MARAACSRTVGGWGTREQQSTVLSARIEVLKGRWRAGESGLNDAHIDE